MNQLVKDFQTYIIQPSDIQKLETLFNGFAKQETENLKHNEWIQIIMEKGLMSNNFGLKFYYEQYRSIIETDEIIPEKLQEQKEVTKQKRPQDRRSQQQNNMNILKQQEEEEKQRLLLKDKMTKNKFLFLVYISANRVYKGYKNPMEKFNEKIFMEPHVLKKMGKPIPKFMQMDETNKKLIKEEVLVSIFDFENDLQRAFTIYQAENHSRNKIMLSWDELSMLNQKISCFSLVKLLSDANIISQNKVSIETVEETVARILPPTGNQKEVHFFQSNKIVQIYNNDLSKKPITTIYDGDPLLSFYDFLFIMGRIGIECSDNNDLKKDIGQAVHKFFSNELGIRTNAQYKNDEQNKTHVKYFSQSGKVFHETMQRSFDKPTDSIKDQITRIKDSTNEEQLDSDPYSILEIQKQNLKFLSDQQPKFEIPQLKKNLEEILPPLPEQYKVVHEFGPDVCFQKKGDQRFEDYIVIGEQPPKPPPDKNKPKANDKKKDKKKDKEERPIIYAGMPQPPPKKTYDYISDYNRELEFDTVGLQDLAKGVMSNVQVKPVQLDEIVYPLNCPQDVLKHIEAGIMLYSEQNFAMSLDNINFAYDEWLRYDDCNDLDSDSELFFEYFRGQIYQSSGRDDLALSQFFGCKQFTDKMPSTNPNKSLPYCGIGNVLFRIEEYQLALRSYLYALDLRETAIGNDNAEVATVYNNLGCCMQMIEFNQEAQVYFELAHAIFDLEFGPHHVKSMTAMRNYEKSKKYYIEQKAPFKKPWVEYYKDWEEKKKPKKGDKKKK